MGLRQVYLGTGRLGQMMQMCMEYNHILPFLAAAGLFCAFRRLEITGRFASFVCKIAPYTLGVYLLHENLGLRYTWQRWLRADDLLKSSTFGHGYGEMQHVTSVGGLFLYTAVAVVCVFAVGILVDMLRALLVRGLDKGLTVLSPYRRLQEFIRHLDDCFKEKEV